MEAVLYCYDGEKPTFKLTADPDGNDDGGRPYDLPKGYHVEETKDGPQIIGELPCTLEEHNGKPLLVDNKSRKAYLLERSRRITQRREEMGMTRQELADALGVTLMEVYQWETYEVEIGTAVLGRIAKVLDCETMDLIN